MATDGFRRHTRASVDAAVHRTYSSLSRHARDAFTRLLAVARARSDLLTHAPARDRSVVQVTALANLARFRRDFVRPPESWTGAAGHPRAVIDALANHLFGKYPMPRFLASVWFGNHDDRMRCVIAHARGQAFRKLPLPIPFTRQMEHHFLRTPDHVEFGPAMRRAEVLGLGGSPELAHVMGTTALGERFTDGDLWRKALAWLVRCGDAVDRTQVDALVDYLTANLHTVSLRGRTFASVMRLVAGWHEQLAAERRAMLSWPRSRWREMTLEASDGRRQLEWTIVEILDTRALIDEGRRMRHCVATYARRCRLDESRIFSLRYRACEDELVRSVITIEVYPRRREIVQLRGPANSRPTGDALSLVRRWAAREGLVLSRYA